ncbi:MAG TPA: peptidase S10 [Bryobacteraceae bacterium]|jgi:carboxypeptidase C (cathepsin A)
MLKFSRLAFLSIPVLLVQPLTFSQGRGQGQRPAAATPEPASDGAKPEPLKEEKPVVTKHEMKLNGRTLSYTATTGMMPIKDDHGKIEANLFYVAYTLDGVPDATKRPLMFSFNGGPGSASIWLHMGCIGPKRVRMQDNGALPAPPYQLVDNDNTWLDQTDLVFVDPVGTGYSRAADAALQHRFNGLTGDIESVGEFIRMYLTRSERWTSPLFLVGESYGTTRAASLAGYLIDHGIAFNGVALLSTVLNFETILFGHGNDLPYLLYLPSYTATAYYHKKLSADQQRNMEATLKESEKWAVSGYNEALVKGDELTDAEYKAAVAKFAHLTGLDPKYVDNSDLRVELMHYLRELMRDQKSMAGRLDSRLVGPAPLDTSETVEFDPSMSAIRPPYTALFSQYVRTELGYKSDATYYVLGGGILRWDYGTQNENRFVNVSDALRSAFAKNPFMKVFVGCGYYDMATPYFAAEYTFSHMGLQPNIRKNVGFHYYTAGHMFYIDVPSHKKLKDDISQFIQSSIGPHGGQ